MEQIAKLGSRIRTPSGDGLITSLGDSGWASIELDNGDQVQHDIHYSGYPSKMKNFFIILPPKSEIINQYPIF